VTARHLVEDLGRLRLDQVTGDHLTALYGRLRQRGLSERTVRYVHVTARRSLRDAVRWRLLAYNAAEAAQGRRRGRGRAGSPSTSLSGTGVPAVLGLRWPAHRGPGRAALLVLAERAVNERPVLATPRSCNVVAHRL
jgi:hypothetical protein